MALANEITIIMVFMKVLGLGSRRNCSHVPVYKTIEHRIEIGFNLSLFVDIMDHITL